MELFGATRLLVKAFDAHGLKYQVHETEQYQEIRVPFGVRNGPFVDVRYISAGRGNDVAVRIMNLVNKVPDEKRRRMLETCNTLNSRYRFLKFRMDPDNDVHVEYDLPDCTGDVCLGEMAFEVFVRIMQILNEGYILIAKALYMDEEPSGLLNLLKGNHDEISITISKTPPPADPENLEHDSRSE